MAEETFQRQPENDKPQGNNGAVDALPTKQGKPLTEEQKERFEWFDKKTEQARKQQQEELIVDFDAAVAEEKKRAIKVKFEGQIYQLPPRAPAGLMFWLNRNLVQGEASDEVNLELIERLLGEDLAAKITDVDKTFISFELINDVILQPVFNHWGVEINNIQESQGEGRAHS